MPIFAKNFVINGQPSKDVQEQSKAAPKSGMYWDNNLRKLVIIEEEKTKPVSVIEKQIETPQEKYKHVKDGELHKLYNTKSPYLKDMAALED